MHSSFVRLWAHFVRPISEQPTRANERLAVVLASVVQPHAPPPPYKLTPPVKGTNCHPWNHPLMLDGLPYVPASATKYFPNLFTRRQPVKRSPRPASAESRSGATKQAEEAEASGAGGGGEAKADGAVADAVADGAAKADGADGVAAGAAQPVVGAPDGAVADGTAAAPAPAPVAPPSTPARKPHAATGAAEESPSEGRFPDDVWAAWSPAERKAALKKKKAKRKSGAAEAATDAAASPDASLALAQRDTAAARAAAPWCLSVSSVEWLLEVLIDPHAKPSVVLSWTYILTQCTVYGPCNAPTATGRPRPGGPHQGRADRTTDPFWRSRPHSKAVEMYVVGGLVGGGGGAPPPPPRALSHALPLTPKPQVRSMLRPGNVEPDDSHREPVGAAAALQPDWSDGQQRRRHRREPREGAL